MQKLENGNILFHDILTVVFDVPEDDCKSFSVVQDFEYGEQLLSFGNILDKCKERGYEGGTILVIAENPLNGSVYRYGNYDDNFWYHVGDMRGYA